VESPVRSGRPDRRTLEEHHAPPVDSPVAPVPGVPVQLPNLERDVTTDLAQYLNIDSSNIEVVSSEAVTWPDSSLGCPKSGMVYTEVLTPGYRVVLRVNGQTYRYHSKGVAAFMRCER
jgi:hypothetical protein